MDIMNFVLEQNVIIIAVVYILGVFLKRTKLIDDRFIPFILLIIATTFALLTNDIGTREKIAQAVMQGVVVTGVAVLSNQIWKQAIRKTIPNDGKEEARG